MCSLVSESWVSLPSHKLQMIQNASSFNSKTFMNFLRHVFWKRHLSNLRQFAYDEWRNLPIDRCRSRFADLIFSKMLFIFKFIPYKLFKFGGLVYNNIMGTNILSMCF